MALFLCQPNTVAPGSPGTCGVSSGPQQVGNCGVGARATGLLG